MDSIQAGLSINISVMGIKIYSAWLAQAEKDLMVAWASPKTVPFFCILMFIIVFMFIFDAVYYVDTLSAEASMYEM